MPKAAKRRKSRKVGGAQPQQTRATSTATSAATENASATTLNARRRAAARKPYPVQELVFPIMVALGCWGMAFTLAVFYADPNRLLFAGMAALMALMWTYSAAMRIRRILIARQQAM